MYPLSTTFGGLSFEKFVFGMCHEGHLWGFLPSVLFLEHLFEYTRPVVVVSYLSLSLSLAPISERFVHFLRFIFFVCIIVFLRILIFSLAFLFPLSCSYLTVVYLTKSTSQGHVMFL